VYYLDLFAGAGGLCEGFQRQGFEGIAHIEMSSDAAATLRTRLAYHQLRSAGNLDIYNKYLKGIVSREYMYSMVPRHLTRSVINECISDDTMQDLFSKIDLLFEERGARASDLDVLIGGPPCQAYSLVGRARDPEGKASDSRNLLYKEYVKFLERYQPKVFVFENVPGIKSAGGGRYLDDLRREVDQVGYTLELKTLNASDFGVLQSRKRVILIGWRKPLSFRYPLFSPLNHDYLVSDVLSDLAPLLPGQTRNVYVEPPTGYQREFRIRDDSTILTQHTTRLHNSRDREIYRLAIEAWNNYQQRLKYTDLPIELRTHNNISSFLDRFKVVGASLRSSHTVVAHIAKDGHYYIHPDIAQLRSLSVREAARLQSFPDDYYFEGPRTSVFTQIGNAVPPLMAFNIASMIKDMLSPAPTTSVASQSVDGRYSVTSS